MALISDFTSHFEDRRKYIAIFGTPKNFIFACLFSGLIWIPTRALVLLGWFFTRRALSIIEHAKERKSGFALEKQG
jgi:hypothetical protein